MCEGYLLQRVGYMLGPLQENRSKILDYLEKAHMWD